MVWQFSVVFRIAHSVSKELASKMGESILDNSPVQIKKTDESSTYTIGIAYCILTTLGVIINYSTKILSKIQAKMRPVMEHQRCENKKLQHPRGPNRQHAVETAMGNNIRLELQYQYIYMVSQGSYADN
jgi:hypothetical protein